MLHVLLVLKNYVIVQTFYVVLAMTKLLKFEPAAGTMLNFVELFY